MSTLITRAVILLTTVLYLTQAKTVIVGEILGNRLIYQKQVELDKILLFKREENVYYKYQNPGLQIKGIAIRDLEDSKAEPSIDRGGIGFEYVNIKLKSKRGSGLKYSVEIYA